MSAASDVYKRQAGLGKNDAEIQLDLLENDAADSFGDGRPLGLRRGLLFLLILRSRRRALLLPARATSSQGRRDGAESALALDELQ